MVRLAVLTVALATLVSAGAAAPATDGEPFFVGFSEDLPKEIGAAAVAPAAGLGGSAFRLTTQWSPGQTAIAGEEAVKLDRAVAASGSQRIVLAVFADAGSKAPQDAAGRESYCTYVRSVLARYPSIRDVVVWNEPNKSLFWNPQLAADGSPVAAVHYQALLARCYDVLHAAFPGVNVIGLALSSTGNDNAGSASPGAFIRTVGDAYRASGRTTPLLDTVGYHPYGTDAAERQELDREGGGGKRDAQLAHALLRRPARLGPQEDRVLPGGRRDPDRLVRHVVVLGCPGAGYGRPRSGSRPVPLLRDNGGSRRHR